MNSDGRQRSRNPPATLQGHAQSHTALLAGSLPNTQPFPTHAAPSTMDTMQMQEPQYQSNPSQQRQVAMTMSHQTQRPVSSTQRSNMKNIQATKSLKTTLSKSQVEARGM